MPRILNVIFGTFWVIIASIFASVGIGTLYQDVQFDGGVERTSGTVDQLTQSYRSRSGTVHQVTYHYSAGNVVFHTVKAAVKFSTWQPLHVGDSLPVKYLQGQPGISRIDLAVEDQEHWRDGEIATPVGILFIGIGLFIAFRPVTSLSR